MTSDPRYIIWKVESLGERICYPTCRVCEGGHTEDCGHVTPGHHPGDSVPVVPGIRSRGSKPLYTLWKCDRRCRFGGHLPGERGWVTQSAVPGVEADPGACGHVTLCIWSGRGSPCRPLTPGTGFVGGHCEYCACVTPGKGSEERCHRGYCGNVTPCAGSGGDHPACCGTVSPGAVPGRGHPGDSRHVTAGTGSGRVSTWTLWTCDSSCRVWFGGVTMKTVDV